MTFKRFTQGSFHQRMAAKQVVKRAIAGPATSQMHKFLKYPAEMLVDGKIPVRIAPFKMSQFEEGYTLYKKAFQRGDGFTKYDIQKDQFKEKLASVSSQVLCMTHSESNKLLCVMPLVDSVLCRSNRSMLGTSYTVVHPDYTGKGIARAMYHIGWKYSIGLGYFGFNSRVAVTTRNIVPVLAVGGQITGVIPSSALLGSYGYVDDLLIFRGYDLHKTFPEYFKESMEARSHLPQLKLCKSIGKQLHFDSAISVKDIKTDKGTVRLRPARNLEDLTRCEEIIRNCALNSQGFALDEFTEDGMFNRKFLRYSTTIVAENTAGDIMGVGLFGPSNLSRAAKPVVAHCYIAVDKQYQGGGLGDHILQHCTDNIKQSGYKHCLMDAFVNNFKMLCLMNKHGFSSRGAMPYCAYVKNYGPMESLIFHRTIN